MKKSVFVLEIITVFIFVCISGCSSNALSNSTTSPNRTTTEPTTLSEEESLKNLIEDYNEAIIRSLKEDFDFLDAEYFGYVNFQDYVKGAESNPNDYFFIGTDMFDLSQTYSDLKFYKNSDVLEDLKTYNVLDVDYLFIYQTVKKNAYGKEENKISYVLVRIDNYPNFHVWVVDCHGKDIASDYMILSGIVDKCNYNY